MPCVALIGGGQLAHMMAAPAAALGISLRVLAADEADPACAVIPVARIGAATDEDAITKLVAEPAPCDVLTFEHEHVSSAQMGRLQARGVNVQPPPQVLRYAQDKLAMRQRLGELGIACPQWAKATTTAEVARFLAPRGRVIAKVPTGGYDGRGVQIVTKPAQVAPWLARGPVLLEELVDFEREVAALLARTPSGQIRSWPLAQTRQEDGMCAQVIAPAPDLSPAEHAAAGQIATRIAHGLGVTGVLAVEMFHTPAGFLVNELAMRPHNSGHWTIEGSVTSQFEQHLRAVLDLPLGDTSMTCEVAVMANVLGADGTDFAGALARATQWGAAKIHWYGKAVRPGRKLGHVTVTGADIAQVWHQATTAAALLRGKDG